MKHILTKIGLAVAILTSVTGLALAEPGVSENEIRIGNVSPYTGPASAFSSPAKTMSAYLDKVNAEGGINGRKLKWISVDDGYNPSRTLQQTRKLVEREDVMFLVSVLGSATNAAIQRYLNDKGVPQFFPNSASTRWNNPADFKWTVPALGRANQEIEARAYAKFLLEENPKARIGILYQNDEYGRDFLTGFRQVVAGRAPSAIVAELGYDKSDALIDAQVDSLQAAGADTLVIFALPKFCAQAIRRASDTGWNPRIVVGVVCSSINYALKPAGLDKAKGVFTGLWLKDPSDPRFANDAEVKAFKAFMAKYYPDGSINILNASAYMMAYSTVEILRKAGPNLTRQSILDIATNLKDWREPLLIDGVVSNLTPDSYVSIKTVPIVQFDGTRWMPHEIISK